MLSASLLSPRGKPLSMSSSATDQNPVDLLADEFSERLRNGETPSIEEYASQHPDLADEIRELFPSIAMM